MHKLTENDTRYRELNRQLQAHFREVLRISREMIKIKSVGANAVHPAVPGRERDKSGEKRNLKQVRINKIGIGMDKN
jgi:hypothetical protein